MAGLRTWYKRFCGNMSVLLLLQQFHVVMVISPEKTSLPGSRVSDRSDENEIAYKAARDTVGSDPAPGKPAPGTVGSDSAPSKPARDTVRSDSAPTRSRMRRSSHPDVVHVQSQLVQLAARLQTQQPSLISKARAYITNCSEDHTGDIEEFGNVQTPTGVIVRLMLALLYSLVGCEEMSRDILADIVDEVGRDTAVEVLDTIRDIADDLDKKEATDSPDNGEPEEDGDDEQEPEEETSFLSDLLTENLLNTQEMMKLTNVLASGDTFDNVTDVDNVVSEIDEFGLDELLGRPNFKWVSYPAESALNTSAMDRTEIDAMADSLNSEDTRRLVSEMTIPVEIDTKTRLLIIYDVSSRQLLSVTEDGALAVRDYDVAILQNQLWVHDDGQVINVGTHLSLVAPSGGNSSASVSLGKKGEVSKWRLYAGRLEYGDGTDCYLRISAASGNDTDVSEGYDITVDCAVDLTAIDVRIISFKEANTPEMFVQHIEHPLSFAKSVLLKLSNTKFLIFIYMLNYIIKTSMPNYKYPTFSKTERVVLENTFFIKNSLKSCKVMSHTNASGVGKLTFEDFSEATMEFQLWYWKDGQIFNVGSHAALEAIITINATGEVISNSSRYTRLWEYHNGTVTALYNKTCRLLVNKFTDQIIVDCSLAKLEKEPEQTWTFVDFDKPNFNNFVDVVCLFFIQSTLWPCEFLTTPSGSVHPLMAPLEDNIFTQLWYTSNGRLIHAELGRALSDRNGTVGMYLQGNSSTTDWVLMSNQITRQENGHALTVDTERNGTVYTSSNLIIGTNSLHHHQLWKFVSVDEASADAESLSCPDNISASLKTFVIRNDQVPGCQLLSVVDNNGTFSVQMKHFDDTSLDKYLWVQHRGVVINVASGLALEPEMAQYEDGVIRVLPRTLHAFQQRQMWQMDEQNILRWKLNSDCFLDYQKHSQNQNGGVLLNCNWQEHSNPVWRYVDLPKDESELADVLDFMCFYFIRSAEEPCQYLTADVDDGSLHLRPLTRHLLANQLWYWNERTLTLATSGQGLGAAGSDFQQGYPWLALTNADKDSNVTSWEFKNNRLVSIPDVAYASTDLENDGRLFLSNSAEDFVFDWSFVNYDTLMQDNNVENCTLPADENTRFFFIRSYLDNCLLLTGTESGQAPVFRYIDQDDLESQLWYHGNGHIVNLKTSLALHADVKTWVNGSPVIMREYYKYAREQRWEIRGSLVYYSEVGSCVLDVDVSNGATIVWCEVHGGNNQRWDFIEFDDNAKFLEDLTCMFFLRNEQKPCELLSHVDNSLLLRPVSNELLNDQIWFWSGDVIVNAASGLALEATRYHYAVLRQKDGQSLYQIWQRDGMHVKNNKTGNLLGMDSASGQLKLFPSNSVGTSDMFKWSFVDLQDGLNTPSLLSCEDDLGTPDVYFIRSEYDKCHVVSEYSNGHVTLLKAGNKNANQAWVIIRRHIVSAKTGNVLRVNGFTDGEPVGTGPRHEHEIRQHWRPTGSSVQLSSSSIALRLDAYNDVCVWRPEGSDQQKWVWLNVKDVEDDTKLLRCSKCYNKKEETANEVMSYIPIFGWLYSAIRAPVYAAKGCDDVALESLRDFGIGAILDIGIAIITVLTAGTASGLAYGVKTALQSGIKAGIKAALKAITSSIKLAIHQALNAGKALLKQGLKKTIVSLTKTGLKNIKLTLKSNIRLIKNLPSTTKSFVVKSASSVKKVSSKLYNSIRSTSYGSFKSSTVNGLRKLPSVLKKKLNRIGNALAEKAENKIKKLEDLKRNKPTSHVRCKRAGSCSFGKGTKSGPKSTPDVNLPKSSAFIPIPDKTVTDNFEALLKAAKRDKYKLGETQNAHFGISRKNLKNRKDPAKFDKDTVHSKVLTEVDEYPYDNSYKRIEKDIQGNKKPQSHTEQALLDDINKTIKKNCNGYLCELYLWTKNSPCMQNKYMFKGGNLGDAKSCFAMLLELCYDHVKRQKTKGFKMCHIGFQDVYGLAGGKNKPADLLEKEFMQELGNLAETVKNLMPHSEDLIEAAKTDMKGFIRFYHIPL